MNNPTHLLAETDKVMEFLRSNLRRIDPEYAEVEKACLEAIQNLKPDTLPLLDTYISAGDEWIAACLRFLFWQGLHLNEACFRDPVQRKFLDLDFEDICQETVLNSLPEAHRAHEIVRSLYHELTEEHHSLLEPATEYYCHLETAGYKLAHYWGFQYGDELLPRVVPGYVPDTGLTSSYRRMIRDYLSFDPEG